MQKPTFKTLVEDVGVSRGYASDILNGKQPPSRPLALHIYSKTGWKHPTIADLTAEQIALLRELEPWSPKQGVA